MVPDWWPVDWALSLFAGSFWPDFGLALVLGLIGGVASLIAGLPKR